MTEGSERPEGSDHQGTVKNGGGGEEGVLKSVRAATSLFGQ